MIRKFLLLLSFVSFSLFLFSCGGGGSSSSGQPSSSPASLRVRVIDSVNRVPLGNVTVVLGDSTGSIVATGTTMGNFNGLYNVPNPGEITFSNPPANATVTAAWSYVDGGKTHYVVETFYDVNTSAITLILPNAPMLPGTVNVNVIDPLNTSHWRIYAGQSDVYVTPTQNPVSVNVNGATLQRDGKISFVVVGYDDNNRQVAYGMLLDQAYSDGMTVNVTLTNSDFINVPFTISNASSAAQGLQSQVYLWRKGGSRARFWQSASQPFPNSFGPSIVPNFADYFNYQAYVIFDSKKSGIADAIVGFFRYSSILAVQQADFSNALTIPSNLQVSGSVISWDGSDLNANYVCVAVYHDTSTELYRYYLYAPPTRSSVPLPKLPASLANFVPSAIDSFYVGNWVSDLFLDYEDFINKIDQYYGGTWLSSSEYTSRMSEAHYSSAISSQSGKSKDRFDNIADHIGQPTDDFFMGNHIGGLH